MKFQLDRRLYIKSKEFWKAIMWRAAIVALYFILMTLAGKDIDGVIAAFLIVCMIFWTIQDVLQNPKEFTLQDGTLYAVQYVSKLYPHNIRINRRRSHTVRAHASVTGITRVQYRRHAGDVTGGAALADFRVMGHIALYTRKGAPIEAEELAENFDAIELYGIKDMEGALSALRAAYPEATLEEITD